MEAHSEQRRFVEGLDKRQLELLCLDMQKALSRLKRHMSTYLEYDQDMIESIMIGSKVTRVSKPIPAKGTYGTKKAKSEQEARIRAEFAEDLRSLISMVERGQNR